MRDYLDVPKDAEGKKAWAREYWRLYMAVLHAEKELAPYAAHVSGISASIDSLPQILLRNGEKIDLTEEANK